MIVSFENFNITAEQEGAKLRKLLLDLVIFILSDHASAFLVLLLSYPGYII